MPNRARNLKDPGDTAAAKSVDRVRCSVCDRPIETTREPRTKELMIRCRHCGTLQHRRVGASAKKRTRRR